MTHKMLYLSQEDIIKNIKLNMKNVFNAVERTLELHSENKVILPSKVVLDLGEREVGRINAMPAYVGGEINLCGIKWIAGFPPNPKKYNLPRASGIIIINSAKTGLPLCIMDGTYISAMRTGAATGVGAKYLARKNSEVICLIGCGVQAITQLKAILHAISNIKEVQLYDINLTAAKNLKETLGSEYPSLKIKIKDSAKEAVQNADIVVTVTVADEPIVKNDWLKKGVLFSHVGSYQEEEKEVLLRSNKLVFDEWEQVLHRKTPMAAKMYLDGDLNDKDIYGNIGEIISSKKKGRENEEEQIYYSPIGLGSEDVAVANYVYNKAKSLDVGKNITLWESPAFHISQ